MNKHEVSEFMTQRIGFTVLSLILAAVPVHGADWPQFRGPHRDGISNEKNWLTDWPPEGPARIWKAAVGTGSATVSIAAGRLYAIGHSAGKDNVFCLDAATGKELWKQSFPGELFATMHEGGPASAPTIDGKSVFIQSRNGELRCLDAATGQEVWIYKLKEHRGVQPMFGFTSAPLVYGKTLIVSAGGPGQSCIALDKETGKIIWKNGNDDASYASPICMKAGEQNYAVIFNSVALAIFNADNGKEVARHGWVTASPMNSRINAATPVILGDSIFIGSGYGKGAAVLKFAPPAAPIESGTLTVVWQNDAFQPQYSTPLSHNGFIYGFDADAGGGDSNGRLICVDAKTGEEKWAQTNPSLGALLLIDGKLLILSRRGELILAEASPAKYSELKRAHIVGGLCRSEPAFCDGRIYIRSVTGELVCLDVTKK